eukprot:CAMPEP_0201519888 /NCGR_PEP_ID=MMETSP0161_2-20130828/10328_1 /ASSEMBLY_ACC=CAM_ASM_000251 /TAXON_ID=180227 /ORGANISM="Neoparamoeba aestuarina, Strain SoJaBio B1-5/56/2" /LENGTH=261 /DNA_ID=CAMNT_0047918065 /DNA_START=162 /DNA_END=947 /DNA_ORIENTATION=-
MSYYPPPNQYGAPPPQGSYYPPQGGSFTGAPPPGGSFYAPPGAAPPGGSFYAPHGGAPAPGGSFYGGGTGGSFGAPPPPKASLGWTGTYYQQITQQEYAEMGKWFQSVDQDRSNSISVQELQNLAFGGIPLGYDVSLKLIKVFDQDYSGTIDFMEYAALHKFIQSMQLAFCRADKNRNGSLDPHEILAALHQGGMSVVSLPTIQALFRKYAKGRPEIGFSDFLGLVAEIALLRTKFELMDRARCGYIQLNLDTLIQICSDV